MPDRGVAGAPVERRQAGHADHVELRRSVHLSDRAVDDLLLDHVGVIGPAEVEREQVGIEFERDDLRLGDIVVRPDAVLSHGLRGGREQQGRGGQDRSGENATPMKSGRKIASSALHGRSILRRRLKVRLRGKPAQ